MSGTTQSGAAIELVDVVKEFAGERVLDEVSLTVPSGQVTVLLGPSGAGKTVTISHIVGLIWPTSGKVLVEGRNLERMTEDEMNAMRRRMGVVQQGTLPFTCGLFYSLNVFENVAFPLRERTRWSEERIRSVTMDNLEIVGLKDRGEAMPDQLSAGMCKRVALARAFVLDARIVIIDDFDSGIDGVRLALLCELLQDIQKRSGASFLVTTHDMATARKLADHVAVINAGRIVAEGSAGEVFDSEQPVVRQLLSGRLEGPIEMGVGDG